MRLTSTFPTTRGPQLMGTMAKHFAHKVQVELDDHSARVHFKGGIALIALADGALYLSVESNDPQGLNTAREVLEDHLLRFAHREDPQPLQWSGPSQVAQQHL